VTIRESIRAYLGEAASAHHRYRSWEHCYRYFRGATTKAIAADRDHAALQLGFYLASWGMYRGSSFLLQYTYTAHLGVIDQLIAQPFAVLWELDFGAGTDDLKVVPIIVEAIEAIRDAYRPFTPESEFRQASDTLVTKIILATFGCLPACDRYFIAGYKAAGFKYSYLNDSFIEQVLQFCRDNLHDLSEAQRDVEATSGMHYPIMKLVDMHFWQIGSQLEKRSSKVSATRGASP
jgi:hypothetical protein